MKTLLTALLLSCSLSTAEAATITPTTPADYRYDRRYEATFNPSDYLVTGTSLACFGCVAGIRAAFGVDFGTTLGGNDLGTLYAWVPTPDWVGGNQLFAGVYNPTPASILIPGALPLLYARIFSLGDIFQAGLGGLGGGLPGQSALNGEWCNPDCPPLIPLPPVPSEIPVPASLVLLLSALMGLAVYRRA